MSDTSDKLIIDGEEVRNATTGPDLTSPSSFCIELPQHPASLLQITAGDSRLIVAIAHDGKVIVNPEFTVDEAARAFWDAVKQLAEGGLA